MRKITEFQETKTGIRPYKDEDGNWVHEMEEYIVARRVRTASSTKRFLNLLIDGICISFLVKSISGLLFTHNFQYKFGKWYITFAISKNFIGNLYCLLCFVGVFLATYDRENPNTNYCHQ